MSIPEGANWLARDEDDVLYSFSDVPSKLPNKTWDSDRGRRSRVTETYSRYSHIAWIDAEPTPVFRVENECEYELGQTKDGSLYNAIRPDHYKGKIDRMTVWEQSYSEEECRGAYKAVIDRYVSRYDRKGGIEDLYKAQECLRRLIEWEESKI